MQINFSSENIDFQLVNPNSIRNWIENILLRAGMNYANIQYIFSNDSYLLGINKKYLQHDYYTDIITFPYTQSPNQIEADIFISIERVRENAENLNLPFDDELLRVIIHGILHLLGMNDHSEEEKLQMRKKEDELIEQYKASIKG